MSNFILIANLILKTISGIELVERFVLKTAVTLKSINEKHDVMMRITHSSD
jgi:hypothetical protein